MAAGERRDRVEPPPIGDVSAPAGVGSTAGDSAREASPSHHRTLPVGLVASLLLHLSPLLLLLSWSSAPAEPAVVIPVQLVLEQPRPPPPAPPRSEPKPPPGNLASEEMGEPAEAAGTPAPAPPAPNLVAPPPQLAVLAPPPPSKPEPPPRPAVAAPAVVHRPEAPPDRPSRPARIPGPAASRDEYLAYLVSLVRRHLDLLPSNLVAGRRGETVLAIMVLDDGTIARIAVARGSGYPDIDARVEQMVAAVRRFPPLPQWYQGPRVELTFRLRFPETLFER